MVKTVYLVCGVPASGKSWVCQQLTDKFEYVHHDGFVGHINHPEAYVKAVAQAAVSAARPILAEAPFSISSIEQPLTRIGHQVIPFFIIEDEKILRDRYKGRGRHEEHIIQGHLSRQKTFLERALTRGAFYGNSTQVLSRLKLSC